MTNRVLYFPYIRIPPSRWLTQALMYWDEVYSIVPSDLQREPHRLGRFMVDLIEHNLVRQVVPGEYVYKLPGFEEEFLGYLDRLGKEVDRRRASLQRGETNRIHMEKMGPLTRRLVTMGLADVPRRGIWYHVQRDTAVEFMAYLAVTLGGHQEIDAMPLTDQAGDLMWLGHDGSRTTSPEQEWQGIRVQILDRVLPVPAGDFSPGSLRRLKEEHGRGLSAFRRRVEREILSISGFPSQAARERRLSLFLEEVREEKDQYESALSSRTRKVLWASLSAIISLLPGGAFPSALLSVAGNVADSRGRRSDTGAFLHAAALEAHSTDEVSSESSDPP